MILTKTRILIAGIGGVGGYFGGLLAKRFCDTPEVEIIFLSRGANLLEIQRNGLKVIKGSDEFIVKPDLATHNATEIGTVDFIILCTKSFDLEKTIQQLKICVREETIILTLLNGVDSRDRIKKILPNNTVLDGCVYIISRLTRPGEVSNTGNIETLYFGADNIEQEKLQLLDQLFKQANIQSTLSKDILSIIWEKFIFISSTATSTAYFDQSIGGILANSGKLEILNQLIDEVSQIAKAKNIALPTDITKVTLNKLKSLPFATTSSMHSDFQNKKPNTELQSLTGYVVDEGRNLGIETPTFDKIFIELQGKNVVE